MDRQTVLNGVKADLAAALGLNEAEIHEDALLAEDLGAESLDILDVVFRLNKRFGLKLQANDFVKYLRGSLTEEEFTDEQGFVTDAGKAQLAKVLPNAVVTGPLVTKKLFSLYTVRFVVDVVHEACKAQAQV